MGIIATLIRNPEVIILTNRFANWPNHIRLKNIKDLADNQRLQYSFLATICSTRWGKRQIVAMHKGEVVKDILQKP
jgi:hypothetical protein